MLTCLFPGLVAQTVLHPEEAAGARRERELAAARRHAARVTSRLAGDRTRGDRAVTSRKSHDTAARHERLSSLLLFQHRDAGRASSQRPPIVS